MLRALGEAKVESKQGAIKVDAEMERLEPATKYGPEYLTYVLWASSRLLAQVVRRSFTEWADDDAPRFGASLAFYTLLSLAPGLVFVVAIAAVVFGHDAAQGQLVFQIQEFVGADVARTIQRVIQVASKPGTGTAATAFSLLIFAFGASSALVELRDALNIIWRVRRARDRTAAAAAMRFLRDRLYSFGVLICCGVLLLVSLAVSAALAGIRDPYPQTARLVLTFLAIALLLAAVYKTVPNVELKWGDVALGAAATSFLFMIGKYLVAIYFARTSPGSIYGTAASPLVVLLWVYYSAQLFFWGAEFTKVYTATLGSRPVRVRFGGRQLENV